MNAIATYPYRPISSYRAKPKLFSQEKRGHPVREELEKCLGTYQLTAQVEEDLPTLALLNNIPGMVAFVCSLKLGDRIVSQGRGSARLSGTTRWVERTIRSAFYGSLLDSIARLTRVDALIDMPKSQDMGVTIPDAYKAPETYDDGISDKQKKFLVSLIYQRVDNKEERERRLQEVESCSKADASDLIKSLMAVQ